MTSQSSFQQIGQSVGTRLRAARVARKLTQGELARPDFSVSYVSAIERGQIHPSLRALEIFAQRLGLSSSDLIEKQTTQVIDRLSVNDESVRSREEKELQFLEAQLLVHRGIADQAITQLHNLILNITTSEQKIKLHYLLGWAYYKLTLYQESEAVLSEALKLVDDEDDYYRVQILNLLGVVYASVQNHVHGLQYQQMCVDWLEKEQPFDRFFVARVYTNIGMHYLYLDKVEEAKQMLEHALSITQELETADQRSLMYLKASRYFVETNKYSYAILSGQKSIQLRLEEYSNSLRSEGYYYLGRILLQGDQRNALAYLENVLHNSIVLQDKLTLASVTGNIADLQLKQGNVDQADEHAKRAYELAKPYGDSLITASILMVLGQITYSNRAYNKGDAHFVAALEMLERLEALKELADQSVFYAQLLEGRGKAREALKYYKKAFESNLKA
jgi:tetratricopeptide (TPR) repeat protein